MGELSSLKYGGISLWTGRYSLYDEALGDLIGKNLDFVGFHEDLVGFIEWVCVKSLGKLWKKLWRNYWESTNLTVSHSSFWHRTNWTAKHKELHR